MADCFSLPNAEELVEFLRKESESMIAEYGNDGYRIKEAAGAIEQLMQENAKLKEERDAAISDINDMSKRYGAYCRYCKTDCAFKLLNGWCKGCREFEWRGVKEEEDAEE